MRTSLFAGAIAISLIFATGSKANADPSVAQIEAEINKAWNKAEPLIEKYNEIHERYQKNKAKQAELQRRIDPLLRQLDLGQLRVGAIAASAYKGGQVDAFNAILSSGTPSALAQRLAFLEMLARDQQRQVQGVSDLKARYDAEKAPIDTLVAELAKQDADLAARRKAIEARLAELQQLRIRAYGTSGSTGSFRPWPCPSEYLPTKGYKAAAFACKQAGIPYVWAASGPKGYDCSGLTLASWKQVGVYLPHNAAMQRRSMPYVSRANLRIGDLVFFYSDLHHVAIYVGNNKIMTAPTFGDFVRMRDMGSMPIHSFGRPA
jgi:cell wall-associated NlpC family hydrolase